MISSGTHQEAERAILGLGSNAVPCLVRLLRTPNPVLATPFKAIGRRANRVRQALYRVVNPFSASAQRAAAAQALRDLGPQAEAALPALTNALRDDQTVSWYAALALAQFGQRGIAALTNALPRSGPEQAGFVCYALGSQGPSASNAIPALARVMEEGSPELGEKAARALGDIGRIAVPRLLRMMDHPAPAVRILAIQALANIGPLARPALPKLIHLATDDQPLVRGAAIDALPQIRPSGIGIAEVLNQTLNDPDPQLRAKASQALKRNQ